MYVETCSEMVVVFYWNNDLFLSYFREPLCFSVFVFILVLWRCLGALDELLCEYNRGRIPEIIVLFFLSQ